MALLPLAALAQKPVRLTSPDGRIGYTFLLARGVPVYSVSYLGKPVIAPSTLGLDFADGSFEQGLKALRPLYHDSTEDYTLVVGKTSHVHDSFRQVTIPLVDPATFRRIDVVVRVFNDGLAFRYDFVHRAGDDSLILTDERTTFHFAGNPRMRAMELPNFTTGHDSPYLLLPLDKVPEDSLWDMPALFDCPGGIYVGVTEAALLDYAGMYLSKRNGVLTSTLSPWPGQQAVKVRSGWPHVSPWRVLLISDRVGALLESNIITDLNAPCAIRDLGWIKPGKSDFHWWNGDVYPDTLYPPGINFQFNKYYIDFCARNRIPYHTVIGYAERAWYQNDGVGYDTGPHADVTKPIPGLDMQQICDYGKRVGVGIRLWLHFYALYPRLDSAFTLYERWGIKGMMVDFMNRDDQQMVKMQTEILRKAAEHHLHIQFHGAYKPTGEDRTYPNEFTREATLNYEVNKWGPAVTAAHDLNIAYTRLLAGSTDYHLGGFRAVPDSLFAVHYTRPLMTGTRCHMLAMYVVLQNALSMVCDYPEAYEGRPGFQFIREVPTNWDETKVPLGQEGAYLVVARRQGRDWYVGGINNDTARDLELPLSFLGAGVYSADIYSDDLEDRVDPNLLDIRTRKVSAGDSLTVHLAAGGGFAMHIRGSLQPLIFSP